ncbi:MAG: hypothetical protein KDB00_03660 [Planctomycetales bacterium]|nr:hypothetical protein [Planctomycetales bacterium]
MPCPRGDVFAVIVQVLTLLMRISYRLGMIRHRTSRLTRNAFFVIVLTSISGCRVAAPIHVWSPPALQSTVGKSVLVPKIVGPQDIAEPLHRKLIHSAPSDAGREVRLIASDDLNQVTQARGEVALASYNDDDESDLALASTARHEHIDFIFRGEILPDLRPRRIDDAGNRITVSWRLMPVDVDHQSEKSGAPMGMPVVVELESALKRYPDLALSPDTETALQAALIRDTIPLIAPSVQRGLVQLEVPYVVPGSKSIRRGNALAVAGRWGEAEAVWQETLNRIPFSSVAVHNLAIAAVAKQDFSNARKLAQMAVRMKPTKLHQSTLVWIERQQRAFHESFQLPDPPEGWSVTRERENHSG